MFGVVEREIGKVNHFCDFVDPITGHVPIKLRRPGMQLRGSLMHQDVGNHFTMVI